ncbi:MAG: MBL fold metallo-hydrolase [Cytophagales bacterium]|nr:MBL fold metallo-hydrolase [Cytophagales bacterium]
MKLVRSDVFEGVDILTVGQHPISEPKLTVNLFLIDGLLIDTGPTRMYKEVLHALESKFINQIFVTHHHEDHTGNVANLSAHFKCPAYSSASCAEMMKRPPKISFAQYMTWGNRPPFYDLKEIDTLSTDRYEFQLIPIPRACARYGGFV